MSAMSNYICRMSHVNPLDVLHYDSGSGCFYTLVLQRNCIF